MNVKEYLEIIKTFFEGHSLINTTFSGNQFEFNANSKVQYPVAHAEYVDQNIGATFVRTHILITIADLFDPNIPTSDEDIFSDCNEIALDFLNYFSNIYDQEFKLIDASSINITKFTNGHVDRVHGCHFIATFEEYRTADICVLPIDSNITTVFEYVADGFVTDDYVTNN